MAGGGYRSCGGLGHQADPPSAAAVGRGSADPGSVWGGLFGIDSAIWSGAGWSAGEASSKKSWPRINAKEANRRRFAPMIADQGKVTWRARHRDREARKVRKNTRGF